MLVMSCLNCDIRWLAYCDLYQNFS